MTRGRRTALAAIVLLLVLAAAAAVAITSGPPSTLPPRKGADRPKLLLLTSLPLLFGDDFSIEGGGSPALEALQSRYDVVPISVTDEAELGRGDVLLMAHPLAQAPENLVTLDQWIRRGGRLLLLADPALEWPSERPLGDRLRPAPMFMDTGLLRHWGLRLDAPDERGPAQRKLAGVKVSAPSPGSLSGGCQIGHQAFVARCRLGRGEAMVVADADFLNAPARSANLQALLKVLAELEHP